MLGTKPHTPGQAVQPASTVLLLACTRKQGIKHRRVQKFYVLKDLPKGCMGSNPPNVARPVSGWVRAKVGPTHISGGPHHRPKKSVCGLEGFPIKHRQLWAAQHILVGTAQLLAKTSSWDIPMRFDRSRNAHFQESHTIASLGGEPKFKV